MRPGPDKPARDLEIEQRLAASRPVASSTFRSQLRHRLIAPLEPPSQPARLRLLIGAYAGSGGLLLAAVALGIAGAGPLSAG